MSAGFFIQMGPVRAFVEGHMVERVSLHGDGLLECSGKIYQVQWPKPLNGERSLREGQVIQTYGPFEPETEEEYPVIHVEKWALIPDGWINGTK